MIIITYICYGPIHNLTGFEAGVTAKSIRPRIRSPGLDSLANSILGTNPLADSVRPRIVYASGFNPLPRIRSPLFFLYFACCKTHVWHCYKTWMQKTLLYIVSLSYLHVRNVQAAFISSQTSFSRLAAFMNNSYNKHAPPLQYGDRIPSCTTVSVIWDLSYFKYLQQQASNKGKISEVRTGLRSVVLGTERPS